MPSPLACGLVAVLIAVSYGAPNPAVNRIDAPIHRNHPTTITSASTGPHVTLKPREPAVNRIDAVGVNLQRKPVRKPQLGTPNDSATDISSLKRRRDPLKERDPASGRIDSINEDMVEEALFSVPGGTPVTLAVSDIQQLEAAATEVVGAASVPMPVISVNPLPHSVTVPPSFFAAPTPGEGAIPFAVPDTQTVIYITVRPDRPIAKLDMGQVLLHALSDLRGTIAQNGQAEWLPTDDWSWMDESWNCLLTADRNLMLGPAGRPQHLTYGILHDALVGLWGAMYSHGKFFACDFEIKDAQWGIVGSGSMNPGRGESLCCF